MECLGLLSMTMIMHFFKLKMLLLNKCQNKQNL